MITALQKSEGDHNYKHDLRKASDKLGKAHNEADIRLLVEGLMQKNGANQYVSKVTFCSDVYGSFYNFFPF